MPLIAGIINSSTSKPGSKSTARSSRAAKRMASTLKHLTRSEEAPGASDSDQQHKKTGFNNLPYELRRKIWLLALPEARVLHITRHSKIVPSIRNGGISFESDAPKKYIVTPASYGLHHPAILSVNSESRDIALSKLTKILDVYWNIEIDSPYVEIKDNAHNDVELLAELCKTGVLKQFKNIAIDWMVWKWQESTRSMEFRVSFSRRFGVYEYPLKTLNKLPNIKKCALVYTEHTLQADIVRPYQSWTLGTPSDDTTLFHVGKMDPLTNWDNSLDQTISKIEAEIEAKQKAELRDTEMEFEVMAIHGRERKFLPLSKLKRPLAGWEMDWFG